MTDEIVGGKRIFTERDVLETLLNAADLYVHKSLDKEQRESLVSVMQTAASKLPADHNANNFVNDLVVQFSKRPWFETEYIFKSYYNESWKRLVERDV